MIDINKKSDEIYQNLKKYILAKYINKSNEQLEVLKNVKDNKFPLVVFKVNSNTIHSITQDAYRLDQVRNLSFEISVLAINIGNYDASVICDELSNLVCEVFNQYYGMQGGLDAKLENINTAHAKKYVLHFNCRWNVRQNIIY